MPSDKTDRRYTEAARAAIGVSTILASIDAVIWLNTPHLASASAYSWLEAFAPVRVWGAVFAVAALAGAAALAGGGRSRWSTTAARVALGTYGAACSMVGTSIVIITMTQRQGGLSGAPKWWLPAAIAIWLFTRPSITTTGRR